MLRKAIVSTVITFMLITPAYAAGDGGHIEIPDHEWSFDGPLGHFDRSALQRGFQVYKEVCSACHGLKHVAYRNLTEIGLSELQAKAVAAEYIVTNATPNDEGDMFDRTALPSDTFVSPYANEAQARYANGGAYPPDLSLIAKARPNGSNYLYALLTGYTDAPHGIKLSPGMYYNKYFAGHQIAMPKPLIDGQVMYADGTESTVDQMALDVTQFLTWAAEPHLEVRKKMGLKVMLFLIVFAGIMYVVKKKVWSDVDVH